MNKYNVSNKYTRIGTWGKPQKYKCLKCGHAVKTYNGLKTHIRRKHT